MHTSDTLTQGRVNGYLIPFIKPLCTGNRSRKFGGRRVVSIRRKRVSGFITQEDLAEFRRLSKAMVRAMTAYNEYHSALRTRLNDGHIVLPGSLLAEPLENCSAVRVFTRREHEQWLRKRQGAGQ